MMLNKDADGLCISCLDSKPPSICVRIGRADLDDALCQLRVSHLDL